jgi:DNA invertase Pin-like site-specific DNA recombinase
MQSGAKTDRAALSRALAALSAGDVLMVTRLDRCQVNEGPSKRLGGSL